MSAMTMRQVTVLRGGRPVVDSVDGHIASGQVTAIVGPNGAGKSSLVRVLAGVDVPASGAVTWDDRDWLRMARRERARIAALVEQDAGTELPLTVRMAVALGRTPHLSMFGAPSANDGAVVSESMTAAGVDRFADRTIDSLSGGERQRTQGVWL